MKSGLYQRMSRFISLFTSTLICVLFIATAFAQAQTKNTTFTMLKRATGPVLIKMENKFQPAWGLGHINKATFNKTGGNTGQVELLIDLRTITFNQKKFQPAVSLLKLYSDPWIKIYATMDNDKNEIKVKWRNHSGNVTGTCNLQKIDIPTKNKKPIKFDFYKFSFAFDLQLKSFACQLHKKLRNYFADQINISGEVVLANVPIENDKNNKEATSPAVDQYVENLGNPLTAKYKSGARVYARNIWDLKAYQGKLYLGHGNSSNIGPAVNAGPIDVWYWNSQDKTFKKEFTVDDEQISHYVETSKYLLIPGHDPKESWKLGNMYVYKDGNWKKVRTIPRGIHCYDLIEFDGKIFSALGTKKGAEVAISSDEGKTWQSHTLKDAYRAYTFFVINNELYVSNFMSVIYKYTGKGFEKINANLFPDSTHSMSALIVRPNNFNNQLIYIGADNTNDHQWAPFGLYKCSSILNAEKITLSETDFPYDIKVDNGICYVLTNERLWDNADADNKVKIWQSKGLKDWTQIFNFKTKGLARSFEIMNGDFFFGIGCTTVKLSNQSGNILKLEAKHINKK